MARSTKEEAQETRNRILDAAEEVFHRQGVAHTSLADVAAAAEVTRGAVYWHFKNKADLFNAMCERVRLPMEEMIEAGSAREADDPLGALRAGLVFCIMQATRNPHSRKVFDILFHRCEFVDETDPVYARQTDVSQRGQKQLERTLMHAIARGQLPTDLDTKLATVALKAHLSGLLHTWLFNPRSFNLATQAERLVDACLHMLKSAETLRKPG
ncbi:MAG TPA: TetR family transcriptional regulator [Noviherbaspirillum sp.]